MSNRAKFWRAVDDMYGESMRAVPALEKDEQAHLIAEREHCPEDSLRAEEIREILIMGNLRLAFVTASRYHTDHYSAEDLAMTAVQGLIRAVDTHDPDASPLPAWIVRQVREHCWRLVYSDQAAEREGYEIASLEYGDDRQLIERVADEDAYDDLDDDLDLTDVERSALRALRYVDPLDRALVSLAYGVDLCSPLVDALVQRRWPGCRGVPRCTVREASELTGVVYSTALRRVTQTLARITPAPSIHPTLWDQPTSDTI